MENEKRLIDANAIPWEEYYVPDPDSNAQWDYKKELSVTKPVVDQMPTVDAVEVVHARWENVQNGKGCCSNCHRLDGIDNLATHCRYCGAKMDGDGNG